MNTKKTTSSNDKTSSNSQPNSEDEIIPVNPTLVTSRWIYVAAAVLSLIGLGDSIYLLVKHLTGQNVQCTISTGCEEVLSSTYAIILGYPLAAIGAFAYFTVFSLAILAVYGYRYARTFLIIVVGCMTLMTMRLIYLQAFVLGKYCEFCLLSAAVTLSLAGLMLVLAFGSKIKNIK